MARSIEVSSGHVTSCQGRTRSDQISSCYVMLDKLRSDQFSSCHVRSVSGHIRSNQDQVMSGQVLSVDITSGKIRTRSGQARSGQVMSCQTQVRTK